MNKKRMLLSAACAVIAISLLGCNANNTDSINPSDSSATESTVSKDLNEALKDAIDFNNPDKYDDSSDLNLDVNISPEYSPTESKDVVFDETFNGMSMDPKVEFDKLLWEKEYNNLAANSITLKNDWDKNISVGGVQVSAISKTDISDIPNYFYDGVNSYSDLETSYFVPYLRLPVKASYSGNRFVNGELVVEVTSMGNNAIIERVLYSIHTNPFEGALKQLADGTNYGDGVIGIGSSYSDVIGCFGEPGVSNEFNMGNGLKSTSITYGSKDARLILEFTWFEEDGLENSVLTMIDWKATSISDELYSQDEIENFIGYINTDEQVGQEQEEYASVESDKEQE